VAVIVDGVGVRSPEGVGDDAVLEFSQTDAVRNLATKLLDAADVMDAMTGTESA
jgi:hypothetical protein